MIKQGIYSIRSFLFEVLPGMLICLLLTIFGLYAANLAGIFLIKVDVLPVGSASPISGVFTAILIGMIIRNAIGLHDTFFLGIKFTLKYALRLGIILLGLRLSLAEALKLGAWGLPLIIVCISCGLIITLYFTKKFKQSQRLGTLIACGTGICGVTAIMAISPVIDAKDDEVSYAVANITIFGLIGLLFYPYLAYNFFAHDPVKAGLFLGTAIHDTAQVTGAALIYGQLYDLENVVDIATVTKLTRNLFIAAVIPFISYSFLQKDQRRAAGRKPPKWYKLIPLFVIGFLLLACLRTIGDMTVSHMDRAFGIFGPSAWESFHMKGSSFGSTYMLGAAMSAVGLSTDFKIFKGLGIKPFYIGIIAAVSIGLISLLLVSLFGHLINV